MSEEDEPLYIKEKLSVNVSEPYKNLYSLGKGIRGRGRGRERRGGMLVMSELVLNTGGRL